MAMAGHKISGYAASLWKALFASFIQLSTRIFHIFHVFHFTSTTATQKPQQPPSPSQSQPSPTHNPDSTSSLCPEPSQPPTPTTQPLVGQSFIDVEQGFDYQDDTMASSKKRGQKRRGAKGNAPKPAGPNDPSAGPSNGTTSKSPAGQSQPTAPPPRASQDSAPARATPATNQGDTKANSNSHQTNGQQATGSGKPGQNRGPQLPQSSVSVNDRKENAVPAKFPSSVSQSQSPAPKPLTSENHDQAQKTGTRSQPATATPTSSSKPEGAEKMPLSQQTLQYLSTSVERLTLNDVSPPKQPSEPKPTTTVPTKIPVPIVVTLPLSERIGTTSAKPTLLPASHLPGLFEPQTEEERVVREYHLQFMREALAMVRLSSSPIMSFFLPSCFQLGISSFEQVKLLMVGGLNIGIDCSLVSLSTTTL